MTKILFKSLGCGSVCEPINCGAMILKLEEAEIKAMTIDFSTEINISRDSFFLTSQVNLILQFLICI